jgi:hypothetical protein
MSAVHCTCDTGTTCMGVHMLLLTPASCFPCRHGSPGCQDTDALTVPAVPLYDSDDETTDSAVVSALASKWTKDWAVA